MHVYTFDMVVVGEGVGLVLICPSSCPLAFSRNYSENESKKQCITLRVYKYVKLETHFQAKMQENVLSLKKERILQHYHLNESSFIRQLSKKQTLNLYTFLGVKGFSFGSKQKSNSNLFFDNFVYPCHQSAC